MRCLCPGLLQGHLLRRVHHGDDNAKLLPTMPPRCGVRLGDEQTGSIPRDVDTETRLLSIHCDVDEGLPMREISPLPRALHWR